MLTCVRQEAFAGYFLFGLATHYRESWYIIIYTTLTLKIKGNHRCIYLIYPVVMATGVSYVQLLWQYAWVHFRSIPLACMISSPYYIQFNKCICNLTSKYSFNCGFKFFLICLTWYILKWYISLITWAIGIRLIYMPTPSGLRPSG